MSALESSRTAFLFHEGSEYRAYRYFGCQRRDNGCVFRVWAPRASRVFVVGDFNMWSEADPMNHIPGTGFWECFVHSNRSVEGSRYKFKIEGHNGIIYKADPFAKCAGSPPETASVALDVSTFRFRDSVWMERRRREFENFKGRSRPVNIYEMRLDSWQRRPDGSYMSYFELADSLAPYLLQMGYTHVQLIAPRACDGEGRCVGFYAPDARFGNSIAFAEFVDIMHRAGLGVIIEWDMKYFSMAEEGLSTFDGSFVFEKSREAEHCGRFDFQSRSVQSYIISNAVYWADCFHIDGICLTDLPGVVYCEGPYPDRSAVSLVKRLNGVMSSYYPDVMMMADRDLPAFAVTSSTSDGLGFTFKWDEVCTRDTISYSAIPLSKRERYTDELASPLKHAFGEAGVLTLSERDILSESESFLAKMPGGYSEKFAGNKVFFTYMMTRPGKKLRFMGSEIGVFDPPEKGRCVQWFLTDYEAHARFQLYCAELNSLYLKEKALWEMDCSPFGFSLDFAIGGIMTYRRFDSDDTEIVVVLNFTPYRIKAHDVGVSNLGTYEELLSSDSERFGGGGVENKVLGSYHAKTGKLDYRLSVDLPPLGAVILKHNKNIK